MQGHELECFGHSPGKGKWELNLTKHSENGRNKIKKEITKKKKKPTKDFFASRLKLMYSKYKFEV